MSKETHSDIESDDERDVGQSRRSRRISWVVFMERPRVRSAGRDVRGHLAPITAAQSRTVPRGGPNDPSLAASTSLTLVKGPHGSMCRAVIGDDRHETRRVAVTVARDQGWVLV